MARKLFKKMQKTFNRVWKIKHWIAVWKNRQIVFSLKKKAKYWTNIIPKKKQKKLFKQQINKIQKRVRLFLINFRAIKVFRTPNNHIKVKIKRLQNLNIGKIMHNYSKTSDKKKRLLIKLIPFSKTFLNLGKTAS